MIHRSIEPSRETVETTYFVLRTAETALSIGIKVAAIAAYVFGYPQIAIALIPLTGIRIRLT